MTAPPKKKIPSVFNQQGMALIGMAFLIFVVLMGFLLSRKNNAEIQAERDRITAHALAQAKEALIAFATRVDLNTTIRNPTPPPNNCDNLNTCERPGDLPCPDTNNDGEGRLSDGNCGSADGADGGESQLNRLGRLPWKTLRIPDIRDGYGERLWYAVSSNFKNNTRFSPLNSDTPGTITLRDGAGVIVHDASAQNGVVAIVFSAGPPLQRQGAATMQDRTCTRGGSADANCLIDETCETPNPRNTNKCNPANYLDTLNGIEDNAQFIDRSGVDGFIAGPIKDASGNFIVNDQLRAITIGDIMPHIERRVLREVRACLTEYAAANNGRYPWAAPLSVSGPPLYGDNTGTLFGRLPDTPFDDTQTFSLSTMSSGWGSECKIVSDANWWNTNNWKEFIFYGFASPQFMPFFIPALSCGSCLQVSPSTSTNKQIVVIAAGRKLAGQNRISNADRGTISNYLELENSTTSDRIFQRGPTTATFNDQTFFWPIP